MSRRHLLVLTVMFAALAVVTLLLRTFAPSQLPPALPAALGVAEPGAAAPSAIARSIPLAEAEELLRSGRPWRAALLMRDYLRQHADASADAVLLAARAEAGWGGWDRVRGLLDGRAWLGTEAGGEGLFLLARALEAEQKWDAAASAYVRYLEVAAPTAAERPVAELRAALASLRAGRAEEGMRLLSGARRHATDVAGWLDLLAAEALAPHGDTARVRQLVLPLPGAEPAGRARRAQVAAHREAQDWAGVRRLAGERRPTDAASDRAELALESARAARRLGEIAAARAELRAALTAAPGSAAALTAAGELESLGELGPADRLTIARVYDRHGQKRRAAEGYRAWLAAAAGTAAERNEVRLALGRALFDAGAFAEAETELRGLADAGSADALYLLGRAQYRAGRTENARTTFLRVAQRFPRSQQGAEALYLVADQYHDAGQNAPARQVYRRVADEFAGRDRAGLALMRLAGMAFLEREFATAARLWDEYRSAYPNGQLWLQATYWSARALEEAGERAAAASRYRAVRQREPLSFYALRAAERLGERFWTVPLVQSPADNRLARSRVEGWMRGIDLLRDAGLTMEAESETERLVRQAGLDPQLLYPLAEALNERGYTTRGIRIGQQLQTREALNPRLLRILYPFPYRSVIEAEARELGIDPLLSAALIRQESMFSARISSPVGARGLMQVMPETGRAVATALGITAWNDELLFQPEINVHLGTRYLADQMRAYAGSLPSVFSAYNAGPHRVESWKRYPEYGDEELFTERIPFRETRDYVKILTRNHAIYQALYGGS